MTLQLIRPLRPVIVFDTHGAAGMTVKQAKQEARAWVRDNARRWPELRAAHLTGGITAMPDETRFPASKDVDLHLIFNDQSPMLAKEGLEFSIIEEAYGGIAIEAGLKPISEYRSAEAVLGNPEIAYHLTVDSLLYDPDGLLGALHDDVRRDYPRRHWVRARLEHERRGLTGAFGLLSAMRQTGGASAEVNILGYTMTFATAALWIATLNPPKMGGRLLLNLRRNLAAYGRLDLHEELLATLGLANISPDMAERFLREATETFDLALSLREAGRMPAHGFAPFAHKLHRHLRPYFVETCRGMLDEGYHREAMGWVLPYHLATADVILAVGPAAAQPLIAARQSALLRTLELDTTEARAAAVSRASRLYGRIFTLAEEIVARHPGMID